MSNWIVFFVACTVAFFILSMFMDGNPGIVTAQLQTALSETSTTVTVDSTDGFLDDDFVVIDGEEICYTTRGATTFSGLTRGCRDTEAAPHLAGKRVYNDSTGFVNRLVGFNVIRSLADDGLIKGTINIIANVPTIAKSFVQMAIWDFPFFNAPGLIYFKYIALMAISAGLIFGFFQLIFRR
jgi:hypothetical protein